MHPGLIRHVIRRRRESDLLLDLRPGALPGLQWASSPAAGRYQISAAGVVSDAGAGNPRDSHYIGGVRTWLLEGQSTDRLIQSTNYGAWTKRGTVALATGQPDPTGATGATRVSGIGATGANDILIGVTGFGASVSLATSLWCKRVSTSGTLKVISTGGASRGEWTVNLAALPDAWVRLTPASPYVTVVTPFTSDASGNGGVWMYASAGAPLTLDLWDSQQEQGAFATSEILTSGAAVGRNAESPYVPWPHAPAGGVEMYGRLIDLGTGTVRGSTRYVQIGGATGARLAVTASSTGVTLDYNDGSTWRSAIATGVWPSLGQQMEFLARLNPDGSLRFEVSINGGASTVGTNTATPGVPAAWSDTKLAINSEYGGGSAGYQALRNLMIPRSPLGSLTAYRARAA